MVLNSSLDYLKDETKSQKLKKIREGKNILSPNLSNRSITSVNQSSDIKLNTSIKNQDFDSTSQNLEITKDQADRVQIIFLSLLSQEVKPEIYTTWFKPIYIDSINNISKDLYNVCLVFPNSFSVDHVKSKYIDLLNKVITKSLIGELRSKNIEIELDFKVSESKTNNQEKSVRAIKTPRKYRKTISSNDNLNPKYLFSNFIIGKCNQLAHAVATQVSKNLGEVYNPLFIYGGVGLGKTHLVNAIGNECKKNNQKVLLVSSEEFVNQLITSIRNSSTQNFKKKFRSLDMLIIDDIQFLAGKERTQEEFFHTFNDLFQRGKQIVITSDKVPQQLVGLEERLRTRFASGISVDMSQPDYETRVAILTKKSEQLRIDISSDVVEYIAENIDSNVRELEGALNRVSALGKTFNSGIDIKIAKDVVESFNPRVCSVDITPVNIQEAVARHFNIGVSDILGKRRTKAISQARHISMYLCRQLTGCSYPELGVLFGGRDHATVIHACKSVEKKMEEDRGLKLEIEALKNAIC